ncbi:hypothetical protein KY289_015447 [Solanum tuberosum]|nr:hypothetical protein KY289_015447 [Solanum tuberosum]
MEIKDFTKGSDPKAEYANEIIVKLKEIKNKHESHENPSVPNEVIHDETIFVDSLNVTKVTVLKKKQPTSRSNSRPKSFSGKGQKEEQDSITSITNNPT